MHAHTDYSSPEHKAEFYRELSRSLCTVCSTSVVIVAGGFNIQLGCMAEMKRYIGG